MAQQGNGNNGGVGGGNGGGGGVGGTGTGTGAGGVGVGVGGGLVSGDTNNSNNSSNNHTKEYKWFNSQSLSLEVQCGVIRLELSDSLHIKFGQLENLTIQSYIACNQLQMHDPAVSTLFSQADLQRNHVVWEQLMYFPIKIRDLLLDALIVFTVVTAEGKVIGGTTMKLFDEAGCLKQGRQKLLFFFDTAGDPNVIVSENKTPGEYYQLLANFDQDFVMEQHYERYRLTNCIENGKYDPKHEWLDRLLLKRIERMREPTVIDDQVLSNPELMLSRLRDEYFGKPLEELELKTFSFLIVDMPTLSYPVLFEERQYPSVDPHYPPTSLLEVLSSCIEKQDENLIEFSLVGKPFSATWLTVVADWDMDQENLSEEQHRKLVHNSRRGAADSTVKPNKDEKLRIDKIIQTVGGDKMSGEERDFLYRFRYSLTENKKALIKFLYSVSWEEDNEVAELPTLLNLWKERAPIDVADALKLLSKEKSFEHAVVREFAVEILKSAADEELLNFLLQLVQALRYEPAVAEATSAPLSSIQPSSSSKSSHTAQTEGTEDTSTAPEVVAMTTATTIGLSSFVQSKSNTDHLSLLARFLIDRACNSPTVANYLYWYLKVETEDEAFGPFFETIFESFIVQLSTHSEQAKTWFKRLLALDNYILRILACQREAREQGKRREGKELCLIKLLESKQLQDIPGGIGWVPMPLNPKIKLTGLIPGTARMFASAIYPCVIEFNELEESPGSEADAYSAVKSSKTYKLMFKSGDDLRQDQLIMQMIALMDSLLKKVNLDLKLLTYGILAVGQKDGIMEFVRNSDAVSGITAKHGSITEYLRVHNPEPMAFDLAMDTFVKSCAGSCVVTFILGVGDRHLDNIMITRAGQMFHIDFGFIFGQDPKPFPPPFRFTRTMADAMGGEDSEHYARFKSYCCQAYNWLRKSANLILNLLSLMGDAGIQDISKRSELPKVLLKVEEKFRLDLTDEQAEQFFLGLINESLHSLAPKLMEVAHQLAVKLR